MALPDGRLKEIMSAFYYVHTQRRWVESLFDGYAETIGYFKSIAEQGQNLRAHGMNKFVPSAATERLIAFFVAGIDGDTAEGKRGYLMTAHLALPLGSPFSPQTSDGMAFRDGAYVLVARGDMDPDALVIMTADDIAGVLVNQSLVDYAPDVIEELRRVLPQHVMVRSYANVADVVAHAQHPATRSRVVMDTSADDDKPYLGM